MRMSVIDASGLVVNVVEADAGYNPGSDLTAMDVYAEIGDSIINGVRVPKEHPPTMDELTLYEAISDVCPIYSVTIVDGTNRSTWSYDPKPEATTQQRADADNVIATIPIGPPKTVTSSDFIGRFTNAEYLALEKKRRDDVAANKVGNAKNWDNVVADAVIKIGKKKVQALKADLVTDGVLTQARADEIFG
jgi:hypothetical protein